MMVNNKKYSVLIITSKLQHYRIPIFNEIVKNSNIDLTIAHSNEKVEGDNILFKQHILQEIEYGPFSIHKGKLFNYCNRFDVVVSMFYLQKLSLMKLLFRRNKKFKLVYWGIGVKASQNSYFDQPTFLNKIRYYIAEKSDAMIFYSDYAKDKYISKGISKNKLFVMQNTVSVYQPTEESVTDKNIYLFIGTLYRSKKIFDLLEIYHSVYNNNNDIFNLEVIGDGPDFMEVKNWIHQHKLENKIVLHGAIVNESEKYKIFKRALACISPGQAGLSVLTSFGYGVPFITSANAITGGERLNIIDGENGVLFKELDDLKLILQDIYDNSNKYKKMGNNAKKYYLTKRTPKIMAEGFIEAINYVKSNELKDY